MITKNDGSSIACVSNWRNNNGKSSYPYFIAITKEQLSEAITAKW